jgi:hypothetical protein
MPSFSFHIRHGNHSGDHKVDLPDARAAHEEATVIFGDMAAVVAAFLSLSLVRDFADRGFFQNLIFSSPLLEVEMILALYLSFAAVVVGIVKAYRRRQDVLYGPYISQNDRKN